MLLGRWAYSVDGEFRMESRWGDDLYYECIHIEGKKGGGGVWYYQNVFLSWVGSDNDAYVFVRVSER